MHRTVAPVVGGRENVHVTACSRCGAQNPPNAKFCMDCGNALERRCPSCGTAAPGSSKFCMECGAALDARPAPERPPPPEPVRPARIQNAALPEERRWVTVLFADISGYTA